MSRRLIAPLFGAALASAVACGGTSKPGGSGKPPAGPPTVAVALADVGLEADAPGGGVTSLTFGDLDARSHRLARLLASRGLTRGDRGSRRGSL